MLRRAVMSLALLAACTGSATANPFARDTASRPQIVWKPIPFGAARVRETRDYMTRHYNIRRARMVGPHVIVEHFTANESFSATWNTFASNAPDPELSEEPGTCAHFVIDRDGTIYQLVRMPVVCRHTVGLNWTAIGIEHVATSDDEILHNRAQLQASLKLTLWLASKYRIALRNIIGHSESLSSPYHRELYKPWACQTHSDWSHADMSIYRRLIRQMATNEHLVLSGRRAGQSTSGCP